MKPVILLDCDGPPADITLRHITAVAEVTDAAVRAWEAAPWQA